MTGEAMASLNHVYSRTEHNQKALESGGEWAHLLTTEIAFQKQSCSGI